MADQPMGGTHQHVVDHNTDGVEDVGKHTNRVTRIILFVLVRRDRAREPDDQHYKKGRDPAPAAARALMPLLVFFTLTQCLAPWSIQFNRWNSRFTREDSSPIGLSATIDLSLPTRANSCPKRPLRRVARNESPVKIQTVSHSVGERDDPAQDPAGPSWNVESPRTTHKCTSIFGSTLDLLHDQSRFSGVKIILPERYFKVAKCECISIRFKVY